MERFRLALRICIAGVGLAWISPATLPADLWDELGSEDAQWALEQARSQLTAALAADGDSGLVPDGPDGKDLPWLKWVLKEATAAEWKTVAAHAADLANGEIQAAMDDAYRWTRSKATEAARDALLENLDKKSLAGMAIELVTADGDRLAKVADALFDPRRSWESVGQLAYDEAKAAAAKALPGELQKLASRGIHFALTGDTAGTAAGDAFFALVAAERQLIEAAHRKILATSGAEIYAAYREARGRGLGPEETMQAIEPLLVRGVAGDLAVGDAGAYFVRSLGGAEGARAVLEACHARDERDFLWCLVEALRNRQEIAAAGTAKRVAAAGEATRVHLERVWRAIGDQLRLAAESAAGRRADLQQRLRADLDFTAADLARLRDAATAAADLCREHDEHREELAELAAALAAAEERTSDLEADLVALDDCRRGEDPTHPDAPAVDAALADLRAAERAVSAARDEACTSGPAPALDAAERAAGLAARGRARLAEMEALARRAARPGGEERDIDPLAENRARAERALAQLDEAHRIAATWRAAFDRIRELTARSTRLGYLAEERRAVVEARLRRWSGDGRADHSLAEAAALERQVGDCASSARLDLDALETPEHRLATESVIELLQQRRARAAAALGNCPARSLAASPAPGPFATASAEARALVAAIEGHAQGAASCAPALAPGPTAAPRAAAVGDTTEGVDTTVGSLGGTPPPASSPPARSAPPPDRRPSANRTVPDLRGLSTEAAGRRLAAEGFEVAWTGGDPAPSAALAYTVQSQSPTAGAVAPSGGVVTLRVHSAFDARRGVPSVAGLAAGEAESRLAAAGFVAELVGGDPAPTADREFRVQDQRPAAGELATPGSRVVVRLHSRHETARATIPRLVGLPAADADARLRAAGFVAEFTGGDPAPTPSTAFTVQSQQPPPETPAAAGSMVRLRVHSAHASSAAPARVAPPPASGPPPPQSSNDSPAADPAEGFLCPAHRTTLERRVSARTLTNAAQCWFNDPDASGLHGVASWGPAASPHAWPDCGRAITARHAPASTSQDGRVAFPARMIVDFYGARRRARVHLSWMAPGPREVPPALLELGRRMLAEAERFGAPCTGASVVSPPASAPQTPAPAAAPTPASPVETRLPCTCTDSTGRRYRMTIAGADCDPTSWQRSDDCQP